MKKSLTLLTAMCMILCNSSCTKARAVDDTPIRNFDLMRYLGGWYEIARFDHSFERGIEFAQAHYSMNADGTVRVENSGIKDGKSKQSIGKAKCPDPANEPARLRVSFFGPFYSDYRVLMLDPEYKYALVSSKGPNYLWILSRTPQLPDEILQTILDEASRRGFDLTRLKWVKQIDMTQQNL